MKTINFSCLPTSVKDEIKNLLSNHGGRELTPIEERKIFELVFELINFDFKEGEIASYFESIFLPLDIKDPKGLGQEIESLLSGIENTISIKSGDQFSLFTVTLIVSGCANHTSIVFVEHDGTGVTDEQMEAILVDSFNAYSELHLFDNNPGEYLSETGYKLIYSTDGKNYPRNSEIVKVVEATTNYVFTGTPSRHL